MLGAMLRANEAALLALESLADDDFYDPANREVFSAMRALSESGRAIDLVTLDAELTRRGKLEAVGGRAVSHRTDARGAFGVQRAGVYPHRG